MPIFCYKCPKGHKTEFLKLSSKDKEPKRCRCVTKAGICSLKLEKVVGGTSWAYVRGKNLNWPLS